MKRRINLRRPQNDQVAMEISFRGDNRKQDKVSEPVTPNQSALRLLRLQTSPSYSVCCTYATTLITDLIVLPSGEGGNVAVYPCLATMRKLLTIVVIRRRQKNHRNDENTFGNEEGK
jgi:hypothetical protein